MPICAIVPVKPFREAKSRLAAVLTPEERASLSRECLAHVLEVLKGVREITRALVISRDTEALQLARKQSAFTVTESGAPELNSALMRATDVAVTFGAEAVLILPSDLPLITAADVAALIHSSRGAAGVWIAPDRRADGTNALLVRPPRAIPYAFGPGSFGQHVELARQRHVPTEVCSIASFALDVDTPEDLELYRSSSRTAG